MSHGLLGRILIATEGINGAVCGSNNSINTLQDYLRNIFPGLTFRSESVERQSYHKLVVRVRDEIVAFGHAVDLRLKAPYIESEELQKEYENVVLLDVRNDYEFEVGTFEGSLTLPIQNFREFAAHVETLDKDAPYVTFCTGGVRCEKATAYMKEHGFTNVKQLKGGIIDYLNTFPDSHFKGANFVFDDRLVSESSKAITTCSHCGTQSSRMMNCFNIACDRLFICCSECDQRMNGSCSDECKSAEKRRKKVVRTKTIGKVLNYYSNVKVAEVELVNRVTEGTEVLIKGKTTDFSQCIGELRQHEGNVVTFMVDAVVRENDVVMVEL
jgi:UPF0176 protein